jgi:uncharacterized protein (DUF2132 family)
MNDEINYRNNPLHGVSLKTLLTEMVSHYGFEILFAYLNINCFKTNPSIESSVKFLKKTDWAREKVEAFYLYEYKNLPRASAEQFELSPRDRIVPADQLPGEPAELSLEDAERLREKRARKAAERGRRDGHRSGGNKPYGGQRSGGYGNNRDSGHDGHRDNSRNNDRPKKDERGPWASTSTPEKSDSDPWGKWKK